MMEAWKRDTPVHCAVRVMHHLLGGDILKLISFAVYMAML